MIENQIYRSQHDTVYVSVYSAIGDRENQEDSYLICSSENAVLAAVCDGMGGRKGGEIASKTAISGLKEHFDGTLYRDSSFFTDIVDELDARVFFLTDQSKRRLHAGTTLASVTLNNGSLDWFSVGDSRIYIMRNGETIQATRDHNYKEMLIDLLQRGNITREQFEKEKNKHAALTSYLGIGGVKLYDISITPLVLKDGDLIIVSTDGFYNAVPMEQIAAMGRKSTDEIIHAVAEIWEGSEMSGRDNTTCIIIKYCVEADEK